jgi:hypothetical protein
MPSVFISYRRGGSAGEAGRLADMLEARFGSERIFRDVDDIPPGEDFTRVIDQALARATTLLVVIGRRWLDARNEGGQRRLDDPQDFVRLEIESALRQGIPVLPVLVQGAQMPAPEQLPESLRPLAHIQAQELSDSRWHYDVGRLIRTLKGRPGILGPGSRKRLRLPVAAVIVLAATIGSYTWLTRTPDLSGRWHLANGNTWMVTQSGSNLNIEETHRESLQVWKKGTGELRGETIVLRLDLVFDRGYHYAGELKLLGGGKTMAGSITLQPDGPRESLALTREPPR